MPANSAPKGVILVSAFDGTRELVPAGKQLLFRFRDGRQKEVVNRSQKKPSLKASLKIAGNLDDLYTVIVSGKGYRQSGFHPVIPLADIVKPIDLMLLPENGTFNFHEARWKVLRATHPKWTTFLKATLSEEKAEERHGAWMEDTPENLAAFLNFAEAMDEVPLRVGTAFDYLKRPLVNDLAKSFFVDRFFAYADAALGEQVENAVREGAFEPALSFLHPGATRSFKEKRFGEANVQITLHENDRKKIGGVNCFKVEIDMDYFHDPLAHLLLEVLPNQFGGASDPRQIYVLRWVAGRSARVREFNPPYRIV